MFGGTDPAGIQARGGSVLSLGWVLALQPRCGICITSVSHEKQYKLIKFPFLGFSS